MDTSEDLGGFNHLLQSPPVVGCAHPMPICDVSSQDAFHCSKLLGTGIWSPEVSFTNTAVSELSLASWRCVLNGKCNILSVFSFISKLGTIKINWNDFKQCGGVKCAKLWQWAFIKTSDSFISNVKFMRWDGNRLMYEPWKDSLHLCWLILPSGKNKKKIIIPKMVPGFPVLVTEWVSPGDNKTRHLQGHHSYAAPNLAIPWVWPIVLMIWFCFPLRDFYPLRSHIRSPCIRRQQLGSSSITTVCLIQCFTVTVMAFSYLHGPLGNSFMLIINPFIFLRIQFYIITICYML